MVFFHINLSQELTKHVDSIIDNEVILNRNDAIRQIIVEHRNGKKK